MSRRFYRCGIHRPSRPQLQGLADAAAAMPPTPAPPKDWWDQFAGISGRIGTAYLGYRGQRDLQKLNLERLRMGLPPMTATDAGVAPGVTVRHEVGGGDAFKKYLPLAAGAAAAWFILPRLLPRRR